jgi:deoxyribodipyrimidine photolyase-related protein
MSVFRKLLDKRQSDSSDRRWLFIPYDQLSDGIGPLAKEDPKSLGIILVENTWKAARRPYHKQKLALILTNLRNFALEQADRGVAVKYVVAHEAYGNALERIITETGPIRMMMPAERELRTDLQGLVKRGDLEFVPHEGWLTTSEHFHESKKKGPPWRMDAFYRYVRQQTGILMEKGKPLGGKLSFDVENRLAWRGEPPAPEVPTFQVDPIKTEVADLIESKLSHHPGQLDLHRLPGTKSEAQNLWAWAKSECLPSFGPYQDAMSKRSSSLFHTRISALLNIHRLLPADIVGDVLGIDLPLPSKEGFIRQVLGWREFVHHVHLATDGFRTLPAGKPAVAEKPGDGGYSRWAGKTWPDKWSSKDPDGGAKPSFLGANNPLPQAYWGEESGLSCLDQVVAQVWREGYGHHITRLMVLANLATLLELSPRELTDWFWVAYGDAYDWVVEPNVLGMGTYALGDLMTTKPYTSGAAYINRMGDFCGSCLFDAKKNCPITNLYWGFLDRHQESLKNNPRLRMIMATLRKRNKSLRHYDQKVFQWLTETLKDGARLTPESLPRN